VRRLILETGSAGKDVICPGTGDRHRERRIFTSTGRDSFFGKLYRSGICEKVFPLCSRPGPPGRSEEYKNCKCRSSFFYKKPCM
jgi:hypothetical protein